MKALIRKGLAVAIVLLLGACTSGPAETPPSSRNTASPRLELSAKPLWRGDDAGLPDIMRSGFDSARFVDGLLLLEWDGTTAVVDPNTGHPVWTASPALRVGDAAKDIELFIPSARAPVAGKALFVGYYTAQREQFVAALNLHTADPLWTVQGRYGVADGNDRLVLLTGNGPVARALDATTGATRWDTPGVWPRFVAADRVVAEISSGDPVLIEEPLDSTVVGLDAATGKQVWSLADRYTRSEVEFVAGDAALVYARTTGSNRDAVIVVDVKSGREITRLGWDWGARETCATDHTTTFACTLDEKLGKYPKDSTILATFDVRTRKSYRAPAQNLDEAEVEAVHGDYVFVRSHYTTWAVDRDGTRTSDNLPGDLIGVDDRHVVVRLPGDTGVIAVYATG